MLIIRNDQLRAFEGHARRNFARQLANQLTSIRPEASKIDLDDFIESGITICKAYRLTTEAECSAFLSIVWRQFGAIPVFPRDALSILHTCTDKSAEKLAKFAAWANAAQAIIGSSFENSAPIDSAIQSCPLTTQPGHWLEIELVGGDDKPIAWTGYQVHLADQTIIYGFLDENGYARLDGLTQAGNCAIQFFELDEDAWTFIGTVGSREKGGA